MAQKVRELMTEQPVTVRPETSLLEVARLMRDRDIGDVVVVDEGKVRGILTDRDLAIRAFAEGLDAAVTPAGDVCSPEVACLGPNDDADQAVELMSARAVRRVPVVDGDRLIGVVSLGDMAVEREPRSALAQISAAEPNH